MLYANNGQLWARGIETKPTLTWQNPVALFETPWPTNAGPIVNHDVTRDGQRFVFVQPVEEAGDAVERPQIIVVQNWFEELKERVPLP